MRVYCYFGNNLLGKIRSIIWDAWRRNEWNPETSKENPASSSILKQHINALAAEQASNDVVRKQAVPLMYDKLGSLCRYLLYFISVEST